jgi:hypothetical protein
LISNRIRVKRKCISIVHLIYLEGSSISKVIVAVRYNFSTFHMDMCTSLDLWTLEFHASQLLYLKIHRPNSLTDTIPQCHIPNAVVIQNAWCVERWRRQGNWFNKNPIHGNPAQWNTDLICQQGYQPSNLLYAYCFSDRINTGKVNTNWKVI